uniref:Uncharacterized protein n=1 Tax=Arundo donax TaxID=35708 RepID=A0A0A9CFU4_ARUDO
MHPIRILFQKANGYQTNTS